MKNKVDKNNQNKMVLKYITSVYLIFMLGVYLLFPGFGGYQTITYEKWKLLLIVSLLYFVGLIVFSLEYRLVSGKTVNGIEQSRRGTQIEQWLIIAYWVLSVISTLLSEHKDIALFGSSRLEGLITITVYCITFLLISRLAIPNRLLISVFSIALILHCVICFVQLSGSNPLSLYPHGLNYYDANTLYSGEFLGTIGNVDIVSAVFSLAIPMLITAFVITKSTMRFLYIISAICCLVALIMSKVAGGLLSVVVCVLLLPSLLVNNKRLKGTLGFVSVVILIVGMVTVYFMGNSIGGTVAELSQVLHGHVEDSFGSSRIFIWKNTLALIKEKPLFGGGPDTLGERIMVHFERYDANLGFTVKSFIDNAHNEYLNIFVNQGIFALCSYIAAIIIVIWKSFKESDNPICKILVAGLFGYLIQAFFGFGSPISSPYFWITFAMLETQNSKKEDEKHVKTI